jgi:hypothetical protein
MGRTMRPWAAVAVLLAVVVVGCGGSGTTGAPVPLDTKPAGRACGSATQRLATSYRSNGQALRGDVNGDGSADRVTLRADRKRPPACRYALVAELRPGIAVVAPVKPLPWPGTSPRLLLLAEIDGRAGLEPVVTLSPAAAYRPGAVFTMRNGKLARLQLEGARPANLFPLYDEFPSGVDCTGERGAIVGTFGNLAQPDSHWDIKRSVYRADGVRFELLRTERFRVKVGPEAAQRWPEVGGDAFRSCPERVS